VHYEPSQGITNISIGVALSKSSGTVFADDIRFYEIKPHNDWIPGALAETYVSTGGRSFNYPTNYGQSLVADLIRDGVTGVKGYVYEPYLSACAHPDILFDAYTQGFYSGESYYMASGYLGWMDCVVGDPKVSPYDLDIVPDLSVVPQDISFSDNSPLEGEVINIMANIQNLGLAPVSNADVSFYVGDPFGGGIYLGSNALDIDGSGSNSTSLSWNTTGYIGDYNITLVVDPNDMYYELNEGNNMANTSITVRSYPIADAGLDSVVDEDALPIFNGSDSTDKTGIANYTWNFGDGSFGYGVTPSHTYTSLGFYVIVLNVTNVHGYWDLDTINITVNNVVPSAEAGEDKTGFEGQPLNFNASGSTDTPSDIDSLNYTWNFGDGYLGYGINITHVYQDNGTYIVNLVVRDDDFAFGIDILNVTLNNSPPFIIPVPLQIIQEDSPFNLTINASDVSGDTITFLDNSSLFEIDPITGRISFTPRNEDVGVHTINITAIDEDGGVSFMEFNMTVENTNDPPLIISSPITEAVEETLYQYDVMVEDEDMLVSPLEVITYSFDSAPAGMEIDSQGRITWIPTDFQASQIFNVIVNVSDGQAYDLQVFGITVTNINDEPVIISTPIISAVEDTYYTYDVNASDVDIGDVLTYKLDMSPQGMIIDESSGVISWLPTNDFVGNNEVIVNVTDSSSAYDTQEFTILVSNTNDAPELEPIGDLEATEDLPFYYQVVATDVDSYDVLSFYDNSELFEIDKNTGIISFTPPNDDVRTYTLKITVKDNEGATDSETIIFTVLNMNDPPALDFISDYLLIEDTPFTFVVTASDIDAGDSITFLDNSTLFDIDGYTGEISFTPTNEDVGVHFVNISVLDENGGMNYQTVTFIIVNVNDPPSIDEDDVLILSDVVSLPVGETFTYQINAFDEDTEDTLTFSDDTDMFDIDPTTGEIAFTPEKKDVGMHTVKITVTDEDGDSDYMTVTFEVVGEEEDEGLELIWLWFVLVLAMAIIIVLVIYLGWKRKKAPPGEETVLFQEVVEVYKEEIEGAKTGNFPPPPPPS
ncbi:MAG: putative Ig domain-containing protein, partial [Thermoplasmata archaeon]